MKEIKLHIADMLQTNLLFLYNTEADKNHNEELELRSTETFPSDLSIVLAICLIISLLGLTGNGIVFWLLCCTIEKTKFTVYIANMAAADFISMLCASIGLLKYFTPLRMNDKFKQLLAIMFFFGDETNSYFMATMSMERYFTIFSPAWYQSHRQKYPTAVICALLWTVSVVLSELDNFLCTRKYISALNIGTLPCMGAKIFHHIVIFGILTPSMVFSTLALFIRMKRKPQENLPARLDITILATVVPHVIFFPATRFIVWILYSFSLGHYPKFYYLTLIFYCTGSSVNPFIYLLVGNWKREKDQEPFCMFLERALGDERKDRMRTQPNQEQV